MSLDERAGGLLTIDLGAIAANYQFLARTAATGCAAVVKADAYGLGMDRVAPALAAAGCRAFFVALADEGIALRRLLPDADIYILNGPPIGAEGDLIAQNLTPVLNDLDQVGRWAAAAAGRDAPLAAILHVDTGMSRLGLDGQETKRLAAEPDRLAGIDIAYLMSHLACAEEPDHPKNAEQLAAFRAARQTLGALPGGASFANSSGIFLGPDYRFDLVRPGAALYGVNPTPDKPNPMAQAVHLQGRILQLRDVDRPMTVGYGATHSVARKGKIITVSVGYADGYLRSLSNRGSARIGAVPLPVLGRVSMDLITLDASDAPDDAVRPGALVDLIGPGHDVDALAAEAGTTGYEILTSLGPRYARRYTDGNG